MASKSQGEFLDPRFAELLKPIKDLTQNWEVPLAEILSDYIDDLENLTITFDGGQTSVNFAQAALLLQGTAAVYSKKVEFLWQMVIQTMEMLRRKKVGEEEMGERVNVELRQKGRKQHVDMTEEFQLLVAELGRNIDIKNDDVSLEDRKKALKFIYVTPRQLIEKEGSGQKAVKVNLYTGVVQAKWDLLAGKEDFKINSQYISIMVGLGQDLKVDNQFVNFGQDDSVPSNQTFPGSPSHDQHTEDAFLSPDTGDQDDIHVTNVSDGEEAQNLSSPGGGDCLASLNAPPSQAILLNTTSEPDFDPWAPLDPYEQVDTPKPMKKGKSIRLPPSLFNKRKTAKTLTPVSEYLMKEMSNSLYNPSMLPSVAPVFYDLAAQENVRRREREKELRLERVTNRPDIMRDVFEDDGQDVFGQNDDDVPDDAADDSPDQFFDFDLPNPHVGDYIGSVVAEDIPNDEDITGDPDSYEELVARRVAQFISQSQEFISSSELAKRVAQWHEKMGPRLNEVERRKAFDVHAYGSRVLDSISKEEAVPFNWVVKGCKAEEIARFFLSTLMLANTENVEISKASGSVSKLGMDNMMLTLLTNTRHHHQLARFQAVSQSGELFDSGIGRTSGGSDFEVTSTNSVGSSPQVNNLKRSTKDNNPDENYKNREDEFRVPVPPKSKGQGKQNNPLSC